MVRLLTSLRTFIDEADKGSVRLHRLDVLAVILRCMDIRRRVRSKSDLSEEDMQRVTEEVEQNTLECLVALSLRMRESDFKQVFLKLLEWSEGSGRTLKEEVEKGTSSVLKYLDRTVPLTKCVHILLQRLQSIFAPYFSYVVDRDLELLGGKPMVSPLLEGKTGGKDSARKRKRRSSALSAELGEEAGRLSFDLGLSMTYACRALERFLTYSDAPVSNTVSVTACSRWIDFGFDCSFVSRPCRARA